MGKTMKENGNRLYLNLRQLVAAMVMVLGIGIATGSAEAEDYFSWETRVDRHGKPAGIFETTPFPIIETTTDYTIKNDEYPEGKTYYLGTIYYVDGGYTGGSNDGSWEHPWTSIGTALSNLSSGNITIIVRGAHDGFDGVYTELGLVLKSGIDDTHRFMIVGYGQERPIINGESTSTSTICGSYGVDLSYATVQRVKIQDNYQNGIRTARMHNYINVVDVWLYHNDKYDIVNSRVWADGNLYFLGSDNCWIFHTTSEHTYGHGFKCGDDARNITLEWSVAKEIGYWDGFPLAEYYGASATGLDFPNDLGDSDGDGYPDRGWNHKIRYNIVETALYIGAQIRRCPNFSFHHNMITDSPKFDDVDMSPKGVTRKQVWVGREDAYGEIYSNLIYNPGSMNAAGISIGSADNNEPHEINVFNNLIYGGRSSSSPVYQSLDTSIHFGSSRNISLNIFNNSIYAGTDGPVFLSTNSAAEGSVINFKNNIFYQAGSGTLIDFNGFSNWSNHDHNVYYAPNGGIGFVLGSDEINADPQWQEIPVGEYSFAKAALTVGSPAIDNGTDLSNLFSSSFNGVTRPQGSGWDIGAYEYISSLTGDVNLDSFVNITDIQACVNHILGTQSYATADVNGDSSVNVLDVQAIVNIILSG